MQRIMLVVNDLHPIIAISFSIIKGLAAQPGRAADAAGAARGLGAIYPAKCYGLLATQHPPIFSLSRRTKILGPSTVGRTRIAW